MNWVESGMSWTESWPIDHSEEQIFSSHSDFLSGHVKIFQTHFYYI